MSGAVDAIGTIVIPLFAAESSWLASAYGDPEDLAQFSGLRCVDYRVTLTVCFSEIDDKTRFRKAAFLVLDDAPELSTIEPFGPVKLFYN